MFINILGLLKTMLTRILDTSNIDMDDPEIRAKLEIDLKRMDHLDHREFAEGCDAFMVVVRPHPEFYHPSLYRFRFELKYGTIKDDEFFPSGKTATFGTQTLPYI
jgi:hypothetical protein